MARKFRSDDTSLWSYRFGSGGDGAKTVSSDSDYDGANASCTGTSGTTALTLGAASTFADGDLILIHQSRGTGVGEYELNKIISGGGGTSLTLELPLQNTYGTGAQILELKQYTSVDVNSTKTWSATAWDGSKGGILGFLCTGSVIIDGTVSAGVSGAGDGYSTSNQGFRGATTQSGQGEGSSGDRNNVSTSANGSGGGGGGNGTSGGAGGGNGGAGTAGSGGAPGSAGATSGNAGLTSLTFGGAGGRGGGTSGEGGFGGGIVFIVGKIITVNGSTGFIKCHGSDGQVGSVGGAGGGGGAGGSVLLKGHTITLNTSRVLAAGGNGGGTAGGGNGGAGGTGRIHADYLVSASGTTSPSIDTRQDFALADYGGMFLFNMI